MKSMMLSASAAVLAMFAGTNVLADDEQAPAYHDGKVVSVTETELVMRNREGKEHSHTVASNAKVTLDGKPAKLTALKAGNRIRVTTEGNDKVTVASIEAIVAGRFFPSDRREAKLARIDDDELVLVGDDSKEVKYELASNAMMTLDGEACKAEDLVPGMRLRVTNHSKNLNQVTLVEAIREYENFAVDYVDGTVISVDGDELVLAPAKKGSEEQTHTMIENVEVTCDGKDCKPSDLRPGMKVRITADRDDPSSAALIEAIEKNKEFASR